MLGVVLQPELAAAAAWDEGGGRSSVQLSALHHVPSADEEEFPLS